MLRWLKKNFSMLIVAASLVGVMIIAFSNREMENAWESILSMDPVWVFCVFGCWAVYVLFEGLGTWLYLRNQAFPIRFGQVFSSTMIGFFYSNITPSAAGGQPMQINSLRKAGIPVGYGTSGVTVRFITNQFTISLMSLVLFFMHQQAVYEQLTGKLWFFGLGWIINFGAVPVVLLAAFHLKWIRKMSDWIIRKMYTFHLIRYPDETRSKVWDMLETYHEALRNLLHQPMQIFLQLLCSLISLMGLTGSVAFVYHAFGLSQMSWGFLLTLSCILFISASYTPLPGASGAQEGGFLLYFNGIFTDGTIGLALLVWRFFTYYIFLITGMFFVLGEKILHLFHKKGHTHPKEPHA